MFGRSCSISADNTKVTSTASSSTADPNDREAETMIIDDDGQLHQLRYPSPSADVEVTSQMDVDELAGDRMVDESISHGVLTSSKPVSGDAGSRAASSTSNSISTHSGAVGATSFYSSAKGKGKDKTKARSRLFPIDVSCSEEGEQDEVDELLNEPDSNALPEQPT
jgi:hypothetical protein